MISLRRELHKIFETLTSNVHYEQAPDRVTYPYLVYELSELSHEDGMSLIEMEVNVLDYGQNSSPVELIADSVQDKFNKFDFMGIDLYFTTYRGARQIVREDDKQIIRRRLTFELHLHERKEE